MDLNQIKKIYIIGIEGAGTSALARLFKAMGKEVAGSDEGDHFFYDVLEKDDIKVFHKFDQANIPQDADLIIYSTSYNENTNVEVRAARETGAKLLTYPEALGALTKTMETIAIAGAHGKTTTSGWLAFVLEKSGKSPSAIIGSKVPQLQGGTLVGKSNLLLIEADEYQNKFQYYAPRVIVLNNIEYDHPDFFKTEEDYVTCFSKFIEKIPVKGFLIANADDKNIMKIANVNTRGKVITYGLKNVEVNYFAYDIKYQAGKQFFKVRLKNDDTEELGDFSIGLAGVHNIYNALAVIATCVELEVDLKDIRTYLEEFTGTAKRMERQGEYRGATIITDYAHHPTEIKATIQALKQIYPKNKLTVVFQPHTYTRTLGLLDDFAKSFSEVDELIILDIYGSAREKQGGVHARDLVKEIRQQATPCLPAGRGNRQPLDSARGKQKIEYIPTLEECEKYLRENLGRGDVVVLMGAGDVFKIGESIIK